MGERSILKSCGQESLESSNGIQYMANLERTKPKNISRQNQSSRDDMEMNPKTYKGDYPSRSLGSRRLEN